MPTITYSETRKTELTAMNKRARAAKKLQSIDSVAQYCNSVEMSSRASSKSAKTHQRMTAKKFFQLTFSERSLIKNFSENH